MQKTIFCACQESNPGRPASSTVAVPTDYKISEPIRRQYKCYLLIYVIIYYFLLYFIIFPMSPTQLPLEWVHGDSFPMVKWPGHEADHSIPISAEVKKMWIYTSVPLYVFMAQCLIS
jgi:hypothetical protein